MRAAQTIGRYRIEKLLGTGAMGEVYRAYDPAIDRLVAIKVLRPELITGGGSDQLLERFRREARAAGRRIHPNIVAIWDFGDDDGRPFLAMEYVEGHSLDVLIKSTGPLPPRRSVSIILQVLNALGFAHDSGIVHRDIKPSNIMVLKGDSVKVADFGIARIDASDFTLVGDLLGTPAYMAPEQFSGASVDHRADLFSVGVILFETLTGVKPFRGKSITEIMSLMEKRGPEDIRALNPAVPESLKRVITNSVAFAPEKRYVDALEFSKAITGAGPFLDEPQDPVPPSAASSTSEVEAARNVRDPQPSLGAASWPPGLLQEIQRDLARFIGPMATVAVKRGVAKTNDILELYSSLSNQVNDARDRAEFLARGRQKAASRANRLPPAVSASPQTTTGQGPRNPATPPGETVIIAIQQDLTRYIGPIARILVKRELGKFETLKKLCLVLAGHIANEADRKAFLNAHGRD